MESSARQQRASGWFLMSGFSPSPATERGLGGEVAGRRCANSPPLHPPPHSWGGGGLSFGNRARDLLARTETPVSLVAKETGFESVFYFSKFFKEKAGMTPTKYRAKQKRKRGGAGLSGAADKRAV